MLPQASVFPQSLPPYARLFTSERDFTLTRRRISGRNWSGQSCCCHAHYIYEVITGLGEHSDIGGKAIFESTADVADGILN